MVRSIILDPFAETDCCRVRGTDHHQDGADELDEAHANERKHHLNVGRGAGEELPGPGAVVVAEGEGLDFGVELIAKVVGHALRSAGGE